MEISVVIPCYNEEDVLPLFYSEITDVLRQMAVSYELLFVDDGSTDQTLSVLHGIVGKDMHTLYLSFSRNFGKEAAIYAGLSHATGRFTVIMDADMQDPPNLLTQMYDLLRRGTCDCVAARRVSRDGEPVLRSSFAKGFYWLISKMTDIEIVDGARDFRMVNRKMLDSILQMKEINRFSKGIFGWVGFRTCWLEYRNVERAAGETKWSFWGLVTYALDGIMNFSQIPLTAMAVLGFLTTLAAIVGILFIVIRKLLFGDPVTGWASMMCVIVMIGGIQMSFLGIIGQYLSKMYLEIKRRPHYIIAETNVSDAHEIQ